MPFADPKRKREYERSRVPRRRAWRRAYNRTWNARKRQEAVRLAAIPPGRSRALDLLREQLKGKQPGPEKTRLEAAVSHLEAVLTGGSVKPRDPDGHATSTPHAVRSRTMAAQVEATDHTQPSRSGRVRTWMDARLPPD